MIKSKGTKNIWLTDFCGSLRVFVSVVIIQIVVFIYALSFLSFTFEFLYKLSILTLLSQFVGISMLVLLCKLSNFFNQFDVVIGVILLTIFVVLLTSFMSQVIGYLDSQLTFNFLLNSSDINYLNIKLSSSAVVICLALIRYFYIQDQWQQQITKLADAKLNALQARIKPHFLFNSLNSIASLVSIDTERAEIAISDFSDLLRRAFTHKEKFITIAEELKWIKQYLAIEKLRLDKRLTVVINCNEDLLTKKIPVLCLQPLVENAILHGIQPLEQGGTVKIDIFKKQNLVIVQVSNPFIIKPNNHTSNQSNGMALDNIKQRLQLHYGSKHHMISTNNHNVYNIEIGIPL